jgi:hypothetical protein
MAVNGIEIEVGQTWVTAVGSEAVIFDRVDGDTWEGRIAGKTVRWDNAGRSGFNGRAKLVRLTHGKIMWVAPAPQAGMVAAFADAQKEAERLREMAVAFATGRRDTDRKPEANATAPAILDAAAKHMRDRAATYDKPEGERSMEQTVDLFNRYHGTSLTEAQGWHFMQVLKDVRMFTRDGYHADSGEDGVAYAALKCEAKAKEVCK